MTLILIILLAADLAAVRALPDLEKRSEAALSAADEGIDIARAAYAKGDEDRTKVALQEIGEYVSLAESSLDDAPKKARNSKYYKRAELKTRAIARRLKSLADEVSADDRKLIDDVQKKVLEIHDHLLDDIMGNKK